MSLSVRVHSDTATTTAADFSNTAWYNSITITNTGAGTLWARFDGTAAVASADNNYVVPAGATRTFRNHNVPFEPAIGTTGTTPVSIIASASCTFTIEFN